MIDVNFFVQNERIFYVIGNGIPGLLTELTLREIALEMLAQEIVSSTDDLLPEEVGKARALMYNIFNS